MGLLKETVRLSSRGPERPHSQQTHRIPTAKNKSQCAGKERTYRLPEICRVPLSVQWVLLVGVRNRAGDGTTVLALTPTTAVGSLLPNQTGKPPDSGDSAWSSQMGLTQFWEIVSPKSNTI